MISKKVLGLTLKFHHPLGLRNEKKVDTVCKLNLKFGTLFSALEIFRGGKSLAETTGGGKSQYSWNS